MALGVFITSFRHFHLCIQWVARFVELQAFVFALVINGLALGVFVGVRQVGVKLLQKGDSYGK